MIYPQEFKIKYDIVSNRDIIEGQHICDDVIKRFGPAIMHGTIIAKEVYKDGKFVCACCEKQLGKYLNNVNRAVEIGTKFGVGSTFLAHRTKHLITIDIVPRTEPVSVWNYFGVNNKITYAVVENDEEKKEYLSDKEFDFAILDGGHTYEEVSFDFECVKKCGRVLFHEYILTESSGKPDKFLPTINFLKTLPQDEITYDDPFAFWEKRND